MRISLLLFFVLLTFTRCQSRETAIDPAMASLLGNWQLADSTTPDPITLLVALDTANPPHDITPFLITGKGLINTYSARFYASVDGKISADTFTATEVGGPAATVLVERDYFGQLARIVRYELTSGHQLKLYYGGTQSGTLLFNKVN